MDIEDLLAAIDAPEQEKMYLRMKHTPGAAKWTSLWGIVWGEFIWDKRGSVYFRELFEAAIFMDADEIKSKQENNKSCV